MNRREALCSMAAGLAGGITAGAVAESIDKEPEPFVCVLTLPEIYWSWPDSEIIRIQSEWKSLFNGSPPCPLVVILPGAKFEAIIDPRKV